MRLRAERRLRNGLCVAGYDGSTRWASAPLRPGTPLAPPTPLFAKLDTAVIDEELARLAAS